MQNRNFVLFLVLSTLVLVGWLALLQFLHPPPKPEVPGPAAQVADNKDNHDKAPENKDKPAENKPPEQPAVKPAPPPPPAAEEPEPKGHAPITLGNPDKDFLTATLNSRGASVTEVRLRDFQAADKDGKPELENGQKKREELVQQQANRDEGSYLLYDADPARDERPYSRLGTRQWQLDDDKDIHKRDDGTIDRVTYHTQIGNVRISKTYSLNPGDYHLGLDLEFENTGDQEVKLRYHLTGAHGLPIEGEWYTNTLRNAVIGTIDDHGSIYRSLQDLRRISFEAGGKEVLGSKDNKAIQYAGITTQYFSALVVVGADDVNKKFLARARPTIETAVLRGKVTDDTDAGRLEVTTKDGTKFTVFLKDTDFEPKRPPQRGDDVSVVYRTDDHDHMVARHVYSGAEANRLLFDDINVHLVSDALDLKPHVELKHHYLLYHGPVKVALLDYMDGNQRPDPNLVKHYRDDLHLNTVTDSPSPGWVGEFSHSIYWTTVLIWCTNQMHRVLYLLHLLTSFLPWHNGITILLLTVLVRGMMFPLSRRQAMTTVKMQALAPEIKKLQEKYKDDRQALGMAQMELYRKHGVNPVGSCWTIFLQMPIFLGLYYALQESIRFRLAPFAWIENLAAPDMLFRWGSSIPYISDPASYGTMFYLGPYLNLLPLIVAVMMLAQQKMMTPPPADEQQEMQQKMMKFMTIFFALMFYKLAAGLCLYFITSSLWGFAERKLLPKKKSDSPGTPPPPPAAPGLFRKAFGRLQALSPLRTEGITNGTVAPTTAVQDAVASGAVAKRNRKNRRKDRDRRRNEAVVAAPAGMPVSSEGNADGWLADMRRRVQTWWQRVLREARKK
jgi:YidC/Oxa1 family membrane protein insertase